MNPHLTPLPEAASTWPSALLLLLPFILCIPEQSSQVMLCTRARKKKKKKDLCSNTQKKKNLISPLVFFLEMSLPLMHQIIRITSPLLFALALAAHIEQANINLRAPQEFQAQPILQHWTAGKGGTALKSRCPGSALSTQVRVQLVIAPQRSREPAGRCPPPSQDLIADGVFAPKDRPLRKPSALASGRR